MVSGETLALGAAGALGVAEATGATNLIPGLGPSTAGGGRGRGGSPTSLPPGLMALLGGQQGLPDGLLSAIANAGVGEETLQAIVENAGGGFPDDLAETIAEASGGVSQGTVQELLSQQAEQYESVIQSLQTATDVPTASEIANELETEFPTANGGEDGGSGSGGGGGGGGGGGDDYDLTDYRGPGGQYVRLLAEGGKATGSTFDDAAGFAEENPYFTAGAATAPYTGGLGIALGAGAEVTSDTLTGGTPLGVRSPIDVTSGGAWWQGSDPLDLAGKSGGDFADWAVSGTASSTEGAWNWATPNRSEVLRAIPGSDTEIMGRTEEGELVVGSDDLGKFDLTDPANQNLLKQASYGGNTYTGGSDYSEPNDDAGSGTLVPTTSQPSREKDTEKDRNPLSGHAVDPSAWGGV